MKNVLILFFFLLSGISYGQVEVIAETLDSTYTPEVTATINADNSVTVTMDFYNVEGQFVQKTKTFPSVQDAIQFRNESIERLDIEIEDYTRRFQIHNKRAKDVKAIGLSKLSQKQAWQNVTVQ